MIKKYIRGNKERCKEVIAELEKLGGVNKNNAFKGTSDGCLYFIDKNNRITNCFQESDTADLILEYFEEIKLPGEKQKLKVIRGDESRGSEVIKALENFGGVNKNHYQGTIPTYYYFIKDGVIEAYLDTYKFFDDYELEIMELTKKKSTLKVIKGDKKRGDEIIKCIENLGGVNKSCCSGENEAFYYFIGNENCIDCYAIEDDFFNDFELEIIELPKKKHVLKVIRGDRKRGEEVIKLLEDMGGENDDVWYDYNDKNRYYFINKEGHVDCRAIDSDFFNDYELEILELPKKQEYSFKPYDRVLVRDSDDYKWMCVLFSHIDNDESFKFVCSGCHWKYCIPYEGNENLVGTKDNPKECI